MTETTECEAPCHPDTCCDECAGYWDRMRDEGFWTDDKGWTAKAIKEMGK